MNFLVTGFGLFAPSWFAVVASWLTGENLIRAGAILGLTMFVRGYHKPWPATVVLTILLLYLDFQNHHAPVYLMLHGLIYLALGGVLFWALDRSLQLLLTVALAMAGIAVFWYLG